MLLLFILKFGFVRREKVDCLVNLEYGLSVRLSVLPYVRAFSSIVTLVFSKFRHGGRNLYEVVLNRAGFSGKKKLPTKLGKWTKYGPKTGFFEFNENFGH